MNVAPMMLVTILAVKGASTRHHPTLHWRPPVKDSSVGRQWELCEVLDVDDPFIGFLLEAVRGLALAYLYKGKHGELSHRSIHHPIYPPVSLCT